MKSFAGRRGIALPEPVYLLLVEHRAAQAAEREHAGTVWEEGGWIFTQPNGRPLDPRRDYAEWKDLLVEAGVREARLHDARHTAATVLMVLGVPERAAMDIMGWSNSGMAKRYQHPSDAMRRDIAVPRRRVSLEGQLRPELRPPGYGPGVSAFTTPRIPGAPGRARNRWERDRPGKLADRRRVVCRTRRALTWGASGAGPLAQWRPSLVTGGPDRRVERRSRAARLVEVDCRSEPRDVVVAPRSNFEGSSSDQHVGVRPSLGAVRGMVDCIVVQVLADVTHCAERRKGLIEIDYLVLNVCAALGRYGDCGCRSKAP